MGLPQLRDVTVITGSEGPLHRLDPRGLYAEGAVAGGGVDDGASEVRAVGSFAPGVPLGRRAVNSFRRRPAAGVAGRSRRAIQQQRCRFPTGWIVVPCQRAQRRVGGIGMC
jgi:hypothetical protein